MLPRWGRFWEAPPLGPFFQTSLDKRMACSFGQSHECTLSRFEDFLPFYEAEEIKVYFLLSIQLVMFLQDR